jgi:hypothetical protein
MVRKWSMVPISLSYTTPPNPARVGGDVDDLSIAARAGVLADGDARSGVVPRPASCA